MSTTLSTKPSFSEAYDRYATATEKMFMSMAEACDLSADLARAVEAMGGLPDLVVGLANGALLPTKIVADELDRPFEIVRIRRESSRHKQRFLAIKQALRLPTWLVTLKPLMHVWRVYQERYSKLEAAPDVFSFDVRGKDVVVVDDAVHTGASARHVVDELRGRGAASVRVAVLCWYEGIGDSGDWRPDIYLHRKDQYYPWSSNSPHLPEFLAWVRQNGLSYWE
ncbi:phosphoribosyltransferase family protein [Muricoccus radiodurans]|uniref:phosphoribosyltransferase family protein n=1 Tax=Muricoccus radiodurans TaxID=2231721 RepID=UPI003CF13DD1